MSNSRKDGHGRCGQCGDEGAWRARRDADHVRHDDYDPGDEDDQDYDCGPRCEMCNPDWRDDELELARLARAAPTFSMADRVLDQVGLCVVLITKR